MSRLERVIQEADPLHWSMRQKEIKQKQQDAEIPRVTCTCNICTYWSAGDKCIAERIELEKQPSADYGPQVICTTFLPAERG